MKQERTISAYKNYFLDFISSLRKEEARKIYYILDMLKVQERVSSKFVKYLREELYEIRTEYGGNIFRVFFIFDDGNIVILFNGFQKKTQKTPPSEIETGIIMENYQEKARENFYRNRPYGIHIDYARKGFVLFNHYTNSLGKQETGSIEGLPLEKFEDVDAIPLNGKIIKNGNQTTDIYFYTDDSNPYRNMKLNMDALKQYNRFIYPLSLFLDRIL